MTENWLMREFARARERAARIPPFARPVVVKGSLRRRDAATDSYAYDVEKIYAYGTICPLCEEQVVLNVFVESWTRLDEDEVSRVRISAPSVHACAKYESAAREHEDIE